MTYSPGLKRLTLRSLLSMSAGQQIWMWCIMQDRGNRNDDSEKGRTELCARRSVDLYRRGVPPSQVGLQVLSSSRANDWTRPPVSFGVAIAQMSTKKPAGLRYAGDEG